MKSTSHFAIGHLLVAALENRGVYLSRVAFVYGNIAPDYDPNLLIPTHFTKTCERRIGEISEGLASRALEEDGRVGAEYSKRLGILCHFICDYFCRAHNKSFEGGLKQHASYENKLDQYLRRHYSALFDLDDVGDDYKVCDSVSQLTSTVADIKEEYLLSSDAFRADLETAFSVCMLVICSLTSISQKNEVPHSQLWFDELIAQLKGYSTGNSMVFRMFFYKNRKNNIFFLPDLLMPPIICRA